MNIHTELVAHAAAQLEELIDKLVLVGGCATGFLVTEPDHVELRSTMDVDVVTTVTKTNDYQQIEARLRSLGFEHVQETYCRFKKDHLLLDLMPVGEEPIGGDVNPWYKEGVELSEKVVLKTGMKISVIHPALFVATKLEAFNNRGDGYFIGSKDMEDIITLVSGRKELADDLHEVSDTAREFIIHEIETLIGDPNFLDNLPGLVKPDPHSQARVPLIIARLVDLAQI